MRGKKENNIQDASMIISFFTMLFVVMLFCLIIGITIFVLSSYQPVMASEISSITYIDDSLLLDDNNKVKYPEKVNESIYYKRLGVFKITAYCHCSKCNGKWAGKPTYSGKMPFPGVTIAVDKQVIPIGQIVRINEHDYIAQDTGSDIKGNRIDIFMDSHEQAKIFGVQYAEVMIKVN